MVNPGKRGGEPADEATPYALDWLRRNAQRDDWFLHANYWDPHSPYRTREEYGNPFADKAPPDWLTGKMIQEHDGAYGLMSAHERGNQAWHRGPFGGSWPRLPDRIACQADFHTWIDGYDIGYRCADDHVGMLLAELDAQGALDDTIAMLRSDHGENQGELDVYGDHSCRSSLQRPYPSTRAL
jgi:choline-sulfatase